MHVGIELKNLLVLSSKQPPAMIEERRRQISGACLRILMTGVGYRCVALAPQYSSICHIDPFDDIAAERCATD